MNDARMSMTDFLTLANLTMKAERTQENPNCDGTCDGFHWFITLNTARRHASFYFTTGFGHATYKGVFSLHIGEIKPVKRGDSTNALNRTYSGRPLTNESFNALAKEHFTPTVPTATSVLSCLALDSMSVIGVEFAEWANEMGYDSDSIKAKKTYKACKRNAVKLKSLMGAELFQTLMNNVECD